jgi:hypothetical protein
MICLSIHQPQAQFLACARSRWHERTWTTGYRGPVVIHASEMVNEWDHIRFSHPKVRLAFRKLCGTRELADAPRGCFVGLAWLISCHKVRKAFPETGGAGEITGPAEIALAPLDAILNHLAEGNVLLGFGRARAFGCEVYGKASPGLWEPDPETQGRILAQARQCCSSTELSMVVNSALSTTQTALEN